MEYKFIMGQYSYILLEHNIMFGMVHALLNYITVLYCYAEYCTSVSVHQWRCALYIRLASI